LHVTELGNDYFHYEKALHEMVGERTGAKYRLGDRVTIKVARVDLETTKIDFSLVDKPASTENDKPTKTTKKPESRKPKAKPSGKPKGLPKKSGRRKSSTAKTTKKSGKKSTKSRKKSTKTKR